LSWPVQGFNARIGLDKSFPEPSKLPPGFGLRQPSGAFAAMQLRESGGGPPHSKTPPRLMQVLFGSFRFWLLNSVNPL
jgi:hypothetical protein